MWQGGRWSIYELDDNPANNSDISQREGKARKGINQEFLVLNLLVVNYNLFLFVLIPVLQYVLFYPEHQNQAGYKKVSDKAYL